MPDIDNFKEGKYVNYNGSLGYFPFSRIVSVNTNDDGTLYNYSLYHKDRSDFVGYENENDHHLQSNSFKA